MSEEDAAAAARLIALNMLATLKCEFRKSLTAAVTSFCVFMRVVVALRCVRCSWPSPTTSNSLSCLRVVVACFGAFTNQTPGVQCIFENVCCAIRRTMLKM